MSKVESVLTLFSLTDSTLRDEIILLRDATECQEVFKNIRRNLFPTSESKRVQDLCILKGVNSSVEYSLLRMEIGDLPIDPRAENVSWYDYLHPNNAKVQKFVKDVLHANNLRLAHKYDEWLSTQSSDVKQRLPTTQNIRDGYFGPDYTKFNVLLSVDV